jgi:4-hydroxy-3-polyprenylbenzoate decarboxylase
MQDQRRIIVGITGASGVIMGYYLLRALKAAPNVETHLITTENVRPIWETETDRPFEELLNLADVRHDASNLASSLASGSFVTAGMVIIPCSMKSLAGVVSGYAENLLLRAADVCLKENRKLILVPRETPLGKVHIRNLKEASDLGCIIVPPMLTFYNNPENISDHIEHIVGKILMQFGLSSKSFKPWQGKDR